MLTDIPLSREARMRAIFETSGRYQCIASPAGKLLDANPAFLCGIAAKPNEAVGKPFWDTAFFSGTPGMQEFAEACIGAAAKGETIQREIWADLPAGLRRFDFIIWPIRDSRGKIAAIAAEATDITGCRQSLEALRRSQKLEEIGRLTGAIAHDFNNLLTPIVGGLDLIQRRLGGDEKTSRLIAAALQSAGRARLLIQHLLAFAKRQRLDVSPANVREAVESVAGLIGRFVGRPAVEIRTQTGEDLPPVRADPGRLELALLALAVNARNAMSGGGTLTISAKAVTVPAGGSGGLAPGSYVRLSVTDTGSGMPTSKPAGLRTMPGLPMVENLAARSGGKFTLECAAGASSIATLWLPASETAPRLESAHLRIKHPRNDSSAI
ncbi:MAG: histidine kinase dimerization/phospho-acceptor domain-containing protein [Rhodomicrobium sp.]